MRGRQLPAFRTHQRDRNTPAYAGKTYILSALNLSDQKHPRVCGEDYSQYISRKLYQETPPRMRGRRPR